MGRFIDCQVALAPWGTKAKFRRAKVGLLRKSNTVYIAIFHSVYSSNNNNKFPIDEHSIEILPAAIRFKDLEKDLFIRQASDEQRYETMVREIKVILKKDKLRQSGKSDALDRFISSIPSINSLNLKDLAPAPVSARLTGNRAALLATSVPDETLHQDEKGPIGYVQGVQLVGQTQINEIDKSRLFNDKLKSIKISGLERVPRQLWQRTSLHQLTLTDCNLTSVPKQLEAFSASLTLLNLSNNRICTLPRSFCCKMNNLRLLDLSHNQIETLPIEIKFFRRLVDLNISENRLRMLPSTFSDLKSLRNLNVANNNLSQLPAFRREEFRLKHLDVSHNPLDGALNEANTFEVHPSFDGHLDYNENLFCPLSPVSKNKFPSLLEISMLRVVRCDRLLKLASEESLPRTIVSTMQRDIFKCYKCNLMSILPAYNSTDILDYVHQVDTLTTTGNYRHGMTFMKLLCRSCFDNMSS